MILIASDTVCVCGHEFLYMVVYMHGIVYSSILFDMFNFKDV